MSKPKAWQTRVLWRKKWIVCTLLIIFPVALEAFAGGQARKPRRHRRAVRNVIRFHPDLTHVINGLAVGPFDFQTFRDGSNLNLERPNPELSGLSFSGCKTRGASLAAFNYAESSMNGAMDVPVVRTRAPRSPPYFRGSPSCDTSDL